MIGLPKTIVIQQCPNSPTVDWAYKLPETIDPENDPVDLDVILKVEKIYYDSGSNKIIQAHFVSVPTNETINIIVRDSHKNYNQYQMVLIFRCDSENVSSNLTLNATVAF